MVENLEKSLKKFIGRDILIIQDGFLESKQLMRKMTYFVEEEILNINDQKREYYLKINLNQIYKVEDIEKGIKIYIDNDTEFSILLK